MIRAYTWQNYEEIRVIRGGKHHVLNIYDMPGTSPHSLLTISSKVKIVSN